jgi:hypothetical protein
MPARRALRALPGRRPERYRGEAGQQPGCTGNPIPRALTNPRLPEPAGGASLLRKLDTVAVPTARLLLTPGSTSISRRSPAAPRRRAAEGAQHGGLASV